MRFPMSGKRAPRFQAIHSKMRILTFSLVLLATNAATGAERDFIRDSLGPVFRDAGL